MTVFTINLRAVFFILFDSLCLLGDVGQPEKKLVYSASDFKGVQDFSAICLAFCSSTFQIIAATQPKVLVYHNWVDPMYRLNLISQAVVVSSDSLWCSDSIIL